MASGEFSLKHTGSSFSKTADGGLSVSSHWQGEATGFGPVFGTLTAATPLADAGATSGSCSWAAQAFPEDGSTVGGLGEGTWEKKAGEHSWTVTMDVEISNGDRLRSTGSIDLETLVYKGTFESL